MNNSAKKARDLLESLGISNPKEMSMEEIAWAKGLIIEKKEMDGSEGRILMSSDAAIITINSNIDYQPKINYIIAHEIGHACLHREKFPLFNDTNKTLSEWYATGQHESEANAFASELLLPTDQFKRMVYKKKLDLSLIEGVASYFQASKTATFLRYKDLGEFPVMIVFIEDGIIKWKSCSTDFPFQYIEYGSKVPAWTVAGDLYHKGIKEKKPEKVKAIEWFPDDFSLQRNPNIMVWEQSFPVTQKSILSCLWMA